MVLDLKNISPIVKCFKPASIFIDQKSLHKMLKEKQKLQTRTSIHVKKMSPDAACSFSGFPFPNNHTEIVFQAA